MESVGLRNRGRGGLLQEDMEPNKTRVDRFGAALSVQYERTVEIINIYIEEVSNYALDCFWLAGRR